MVCRVSLSGAILLLDVTVDANSTEVCLDAAEVRGGASGAIRDLAVCGVGLEG